MLRDLLLGLIAAFGAVPSLMAYPAAIVFLYFSIRMLHRYFNSRKWRKLEEIREEYEPLEKLFKKKKLNTYLEQIVKLKERLFSERDRVEELQSLIRDELPKIEKRLEEISRAISSPAPESEKKEMEILIEQLGRNSLTLRSREADLQAFETTKARLASRMNCLRNRFNDIEYDETEIKGILESIDSISFVADIFDRK